jgi:dienelactone hydrolase
MLMSEYFSRLSRKHKPKYSFINKPDQDFNTWRNELLPLIKKGLGRFPEPVDLNAEIVWEQEEEDGLIKRRVMLDMEEDISAAALIYIPKEAMNKPLPAILCNHGHGQFGKDSVMGIRIGNYPERAKEIAGYNYDYGLQMAKHGYVTMAIDWRAFGERNEPLDIFHGRDKCNIYYIMANLTGINLLAMDVFDGMRCIDYLCDQSFVDKEKIGTMGLSFGGTMTTWITLMDERVKAADIICYSALFSSFALGRGNFCGSQTFHALYELCDVPDLHGLIAPRPLLAEVGLQDLCFRADEALECTRQVQAIYNAAGAGKNYETDIFNGGHQFAGDKAFAFFDKHLKGAV